MKKKIYIWYPILVSLGQGFIFMNIPPVNRQFMELMGVGYDGLSWFLSGLFWSHALTQIPAGFIADRCNSWKVVMVGLAICLLANVLPFLDPTSLALAIGMRLLLGLGTSLSFMAIMKILLTLAPAEKVTTIQGFQGAAFALGLVVPYLILPHLGNLGWAYAYILSIVLIVAAIAAAFMLPKSELNPPAEVRPVSEVKKALWEILTFKAIWFLGIFHGLAYGSLNNLGSWLPSILADLSGGSVGAWAGAAVIVLLLGAFGRAFVGGFLTFLKRSQAVNGAILIICILYILMSLTGHKQMVIIIAALMAMACGSTYGGVFSLSAAVGAAYAATAMGAMNMIGNLFNIVLTLIFGYVREYTGEFSPSLLAVGILGLMCWLAGRGHITRLAEKVHQ